MPIRMHSTVKDFIRKSDSEEDFGVGDDGEEQWTMKGLVEKLKIEQVIFG